MSSISYLNSTQFSAVSAYKCTELSPATKLRLEALGIDPSTVQSESQAQILIAQAEAAQSQNNSGKQQGGNSTRAQLVSEAKELAQQVGANVSDKDTLENMLENIAERLNYLVQNPAIADKVSKYQEKLKDLAGRANVMVQIQQNIFDNLNMVSISNKLILGL